MASESVFDIDGLCAPVSEDQPAGPYWRDDEECRSKWFPDVDTAMRDARTNERKRSEVALFAEDSIERKRYEDPDWRAVIGPSQKLLARSKDLWVASWLVEAMAREHGFAGLRDGFKLINRLVKTYWDQIHPRPDDIDGIRHTLAQMDGDIWAKLIPLMPITKTGYSTADYDRSTEMEGLDSDSDRDTYRAMGVITTAEFESQIGNSGTEFLVDVLEDAEAALSEFETLTEFLDEKCGMDAPASSTANENFSQCLDLIRELAAPWLPSEMIEEEPGEGDGEIEEGASTGPSASAETNSGWNRDRAFQEIGRQAELFEKNEPNSPVASILRQAVRLGKLSWQDLISGLTEDQAALIQILKQTGITDRPDESDN